MYVITGYVFVKTYHFVALKQNSTDIEHILTVSLVVGYIYCNIVYLIPFSISYTVDNILIVLSALILGYLFAILLRQKKIIYILDILRIRETGNMYLWDDLMDNNYPMKISIEYEDRIYEGMLHNYEGYSNNPHVAIASYIVKDNLKNIIEDFSEDKTKVAILDTEKANCIHIEYHINSNECKDLKNLCDFHQSFKEHNREN